MIAEPRRLIRGRKRDVVMSNYAETKKKIDAIRKKNEVMFRMAISHLMDVGIRHFTQDNVEETCQNIMKEDDTHSFMTNEYKCGLVRMTYELAQISLNSQVDLLVYIQREIDYDVFDGATNYSRAIKLLIKCMAEIEQCYDCNKKEVLDTFQYIGFDDDELYNFGYGYLLEEDN